MMRHSRALRLFSAAVLLAVNSAASLCAEPVELKAPGVIVRANQWNDVQLQDEAGHVLVTLTGFHVKWKPVQQTVGGTVRSITTADGRAAIEVAYETQADADEKKISIVGQFTPAPGRLDVQFELSGVPTNADVNLGGSMIGRNLAKGAKPLPAAKLGLWERHAFGGVPYEINDGTQVRYLVDKTQICFAFDAGSRPNTSWQDGQTQHAALKKIAADHFVSQFSILIPPADWSPEAVSAQRHGRPVSLSIGTDHVYNWWSNAREPLAVKREVVNTSLETRDVEVSYWVRNFAGEELAKESKTITLRPGEAFREPALITVPTARNLLFVEVAARDLKTDREVFARTNLAVLPPHEFKSTTDNSIFGLAAYWPYPSEEDVQTLMDRMGVRWLRGGDTRIQHAGRIANHHSSVDLNKSWTNETRDEWIKKQLASCVERKNPAWEFCNEINMSTAGIAQEGTGIGKALLAEKYLEWVRHVRRIQKETGTEQIKLLSFGVAGMDVKFWQRMYDLGGWNYFDGMCLHPGRGNFTADYPVSEPWQNWVVGSTGNYWNYYGSIRTAQKFIQDHGEHHDLWLTEVYACTYPNSFWEDTPRNAAENVVLQFALAKAEGVKAVMWYQLNDSVWFDQLGVNPKDREYYFGLLNRDLSLKPALMAYCTAAEALDQAKFVRWIKFDDEKNRGLLFDTPRGPMAILWSRADGFTLTKKTEPYATPEPWVDTWKTKTPVELPAASGELTLINPIGVEKKTPATGGKATVALDGAPVIVYGVDAAKLK